MRRQLLFLSVILTLVGLSTASIVCAQRRIPRPPIPRPRRPRPRPLPPIKFGLRYVPHSTVKLEQLNGETDKELHKPTLSRTVTRYKLQGSDLGTSFEFHGKVLFLFGDTVVALDKGLDSLATTDSTDPEQGVILDYLTSPEPLGQPYLTIQPPGINMGAFNVPVAGITLQGQTYIVVKTGHSSKPTDRSVLTRYYPNNDVPEMFLPIRTISQLPAGHFIKMSVHTEPQPIPGLPVGGPYVLIWGTGLYRHSDAYVAIVPVASIESGAGTLYYAGLDASGVPKWSGRETDASPIVKNGTMGDISVTWCNNLRLWLMTYDSRPPAPAGILYSWSRTPWGPWSPPQVIFNPVRDGALGKFIHDPRITPDDGLEGPVIGKGKSNPKAVMGGSYAPYVIERWTKVRGASLDIYYALSTWNPYVVMLMRSSLQIR